MLISIAISTNASLFLMWQWENDTPIPLTPFTVLALLDAVDGCFSVIQKTCWLQFENNDVLQCARTKTRPACKYLAYVSLIFITVERYQIYEKKPFRVTKTNLVTNSFLSTCTRSLYVETQLRAFFSAIGSPTPLSCEFENEHVPKKNTRLIKTPPP